MQTAPFADANCNRAPIVFPFTPLPDVKYTVLRERRRDGLASSTPRRSGTRLPMLQGSRGQYGGRSAEVRPPSTRVLPHSMRRRSDGFAIPRPPHAVPGVAHVMPHGTQLGQATAPSRPPQVVKLAASGGRERVEVTPDVEATDVRVRAEENRLSAFPSVEQLQLTGFPAKCLPASAQLDEIASSPPHRMSFGASGSSMRTTMGMSSSNTCASSSNPSPTAPIVKGAMLAVLNTYEEEEVAAYLPNVFFCGSEQCHKVIGCRGQACNDGYDDAEAHYRVVLGDHLAYRYEVVRELGRGTFGVVVQAFDHRLQCPVAVKIIKNKANYSRQATEEVALLELLRRDDPHNTARVVHLLDVCTFRQHLLLTFELLSVDLYGLCRANHYRPMPLYFIRDFVRQMLVALQYIREHHVIHCDVKPENIVLCEGPVSGGAGGGDVVAASPTVKLIDFGSACRDGRQMYSYIQSRYYRAPEVVLGMRYSYAIDIWGLGCVLCELANGYPIFPASNEGELLEYMIAYLGAIPPAVLAQGTRRSQFFSDDGTLRPVVRPRSSRRARPPTRGSLRAFLKAASSPRDEDFVDFVRQCLTYDPAQRLTPSTALHHPWLSKSISIRVEQ